MQIDRVATWPDIWGRVRRCEKKIERADGALYQRSICKGRGRHRRRGKYWLRQLERSALVFGFLVKDALARNDREQKEIDALVEEACK